MGARAYLRSLSGRLSPLGEVAIPYEQVCRIRVAEDASLQAINGAHADDPRVAHMELNQMISVPESVQEEAQRR
ncbi:MAG: hypothetical protein P1P84_07585 [Deferrisomatales bacterium]|nr:hypothetical protein [Deferrisomatales bacterium]